MPPRTTTTIDLRAIVREGMASRNVTSVRQLEHLAGVPDNTLARWLNGSRSCKAETIEAVLIALDLEVRPRQT